LPLQRLVQFQQQGAVEGAGGAAHGHHQGHAALAQQRRQGQGGQGVRLGQHRLGAAFHVEAVVAIADRPIQVGQFFGVLDQPEGRRFDQAPGPGIGWPQLASVWSSGLVQLPASCTAAPGHPVDS